MTLELDIPGWRSLHLRHLVLDVNGTLARDGVLLPGVESRLAALQGVLDVRLLSADTFGTLAAIADTLGVRADRLDRGEADTPQKERLVQQLGAASVIAIGNGANDAAMLRQADLALVVLGPEGLALPALVEADVVAASILDALDLLLNPKRLIATLRR